MPITAPADSILHAVAGILPAVEAGTEVPYATTLEKGRGHRPVLTAPTGAGEEARL